MSVDPPQSDSGSDDEFLSQVREAAQRSESVEGPLNSETQTAAPGPGTIPKKIGHFHIKSVLASGGMGTVYEATQENPRRVVAIKVMKHGITSESALRRFEYESQILARLRHPGVAQIYEAGTHDDAAGAGPVPYFAMEYIPNAKPITEYAREKKLGTRQRLELFAHVCDAVYHGHQKGIIHRDLKPGNILVDSHGEVKVIDFGVARGTDSDMAVTTLQTDIGQLLGTLQYMSPEQCRADPHDIDTRSDIYELGVVLFELLSGKLPYDVSTKPVFEGTRVIREEQPARLSTIDATLKGDTETIVLKALEKDRDRRYQSAVELAADIRRYLSGEAIVARPPSIVYQLSVFARKNKGFFGALAAVFVVLVAGVVVSTSMYLRSEAHRAKAESEAVKAQATLGFLEERLRAVDPNKARGREVTVHSMLDEAARQIEAGELADQPEAEASLRATLGQTYRSLGLYASAEPHLRAALTIRKRVLGDEHADVAQSLHDLGNLFSKKFEFDAAEPLYREALAMRRKLLGEEHRDTLWSMVVSAGFLRRQDNLQEAESLVRRTLDIQKRVLGTEDRDTLSSMNLLANVLWDQNKKGRAMALFRKTLQISRRVLGEDHIHTWYLAGNLGGLLVETGNYAEAEPLLRQSLAMWRNLLGDEHPDLNYPLANLAFLLSTKGEYAEAETLTRELLELDRSALGHENARTLASSDRLAYTLLDTGKLTEAEELSRRTLEASPRVLGDDHRTTLSSMDTLAWVLMREGKLAEAEELSRRCWERSRRVLGNEHRMTVLAMHTLAKILRETGKLTEAEELSRRALEAFRRVLGDEQRTTLWSMRTLATVLTAQGKLTEAEELSRKCLERSRRVLGEGHHATLSSMDALVRILGAQGKLEEVRPYVTELLDAERRLAHHPEATARQVEDYAWELLICEPADLRDLSAALPLAKKAVEMSGGKDASTLDTLALAYKMSGDIDKGVETQRRAVRLLAPGESANRTAFETRLVSFLGEKGDHAAAAMLHELIARMRKAHGERHAELVRRMTDLALLLFAEGKYILGDRVCEGELLQLRRGIVPQPEPGNAHLVVTYATALVKQQEHGEADPLLRHCLDIRKAALPEGDWRAQGAGWQVAEVMSLLGASLVGQGKFGEAEPLLLDGYKQMRDNARTIPDAIRKDRLREALERVVSLYESRAAGEPGQGHDSKAGEWRAKLPGEGPEAKGDGDGAGTNPEGAEGEEPGSPPATRP